LHSAVARRIFFELKANASITLRLFMALLLITGTAGISVNQHFCSMMGPSASLTVQSSCCGGNETASRGTESLSRVPCCDNTLQTASVDQSFEGASAPRPLLLASVALTADATADAETFFPRTLRSDNDISPHIRLSLSETVNHLRS
jgi:hypothetical protein